jgi:hypothetical protein
MVGKEVDTRVSLADMVNHGNVDSVLSDKVVDIDL